MLAIVEIAGQQLDQKVITDSEYMVFCDKGKSFQYRNITTNIKGMYNIMNAVKEDLECFEKYDY